MALDNDSTLDAAPGAPAGAPADWQRGVLEKLALAALREQRAARRWRIFFRLAFLALAVFVIAKLFGPAHEGALSTRHTAVVTLEGEIASHGQANAEHVDAALDAAFADKNAAGVILRINSPGGSPVQAGMINDHIRRLRKQHPHTPLYAVVDDICASGGYYVAVAADKIFVDKASIVGSIGVRMDGFGFTGLMDKLGIERRLLTAGANKGLFDPFSPETDKQKAYAKAMLDEIHAQFIDAVRQGRGQRLKDDPEMFSGLVWTGRKSVELGLTDGLGDTAYVARELFKAPRTVDYSVKDGLTERVARRFGAVLYDTAGAVAAGFRESALQ